MEIVIATTNPKKAKAIEDAVLAFGFQDIELTFLDKDAPDFKEVEETGKTVEENAILKARARCKETGLPTITDDSGFFIKSLEEESGVDVIEAVNKAGGFDEYFKKLQTDLKDKDTTAYVITTIAFAIPNPNNPDEPIIKTFECRVEGHLQFPASPVKGNLEPHIDRIFVPKGNECTFSKMAPKEKDKIYHRSIALRKLFSYLATNYPENAPKNNPSSTSQRITGR